MRNFRNLDIWKLSIELSKEIYIITNDFPTNERFGLSSQIQRASVSIASNIAEGSSRKSEIDFARFLEISLGSAFEVETQLTIAKEIEYIDNTIYEANINRLNILQKKINTLITKIRKG